jgi:ABC-type transport system involved in cytochrome c biogenesis permease subunit
MAPHPSALTLFVLAPLVSWRVYLRFRRSIGRQKMSPVRPWIQLVLFPTLVVLFAVATRNHPLGLWLLAGGLVLGGGLSVYGLRLTQFEVTPERLYYTPHAPLGIVLSLLFVARIIYRIFEVYVLDTNAGPGVEAFAQSPVTLAVFGLLAGYYIGYALGLVRWRWDVLERKRAREAAAASDLGDDPSGR